MYTNVTVHVYPGSPQDWQRDSGVAMCYYIQTSCAVPTVDCITDHVMQISGEGHIGFR